MGEYNQKNPFMARLVERRSLTSHASTKDTRHFVVDISGSDMAYTCGDSLGVIPENNPKDVDALIAALKWNPEENIVLPKSEEVLTLRDAFLKKVSLAHVTKAFLVFYQGHLVDSYEKEMLEALIDGDADQLKSYLATRHVIDIIEAFPNSICKPVDFLAKLRRLVPRLYSIASAPSVYPSEVHLTVALVRYEMHGRKREGVASTYLAERVAINTPTLPVFVATSKFGLPEDESKDLIMVGPGTGIAPFRAFIQERIQKKDTGRMWLFFGDRQREYDYLYGEELDKYHKEGVLSRLDLAFSRDQEHKIYVQDRMLENAKQLWEWLDRGAYFYVCGDAERMAKDVDATFKMIIQQEGGMSEEEALAFIKALKKEGRYQRDVY